MAAASKTPYVILRRDQIAAGRQSTLEAAATAEPRVVWEEFGRAEGHSGQQACDTFLDGAELDEGEYVLKAVPARSWPDKPHFEGVVQRQLTVIRKTEPARETVNA
jgi:hypothetical protein